MAWHKSLIDAFRAWLHKDPDPHRICWHCKRQIKRREKYRHIKVGWFAPVFTVEHRDCKNPTLEKPVDYGPELPFPAEQLHQALGFLPQSPDRELVHSILENMETLP